MGYMSMPVFDHIRFGSVQVADAMGVPRNVPLDGIQLVRRLYLPTGTVTGSHPLWPLPANVDRSLLLVFAGEQDPEDPSNFLPLTPEMLAADDFMPEPHAVHFDRPLRVLVCCELVLCKERNDFEPIGVLAAARVHPHVLVMTNQPSERVSATIELSRPATHGMADPHMTPDIGSAMFADTNDTSPGSAC